MSRISVLFLALSFSLGTFSQKYSGKAIYSVKTDFSFDKKIKKGELDLLKRIFTESKNSKKIKYALVFNNNESLFYGISELKTNEFKIDLSSLKAKITGKIYVNLKEKKYTQQKEKFGETFLINKDLNSYQWNLTNGTIRLGKYLCYKAVLKSSLKKKNKTIAWYTTDIPLNMGPMGYTGLPGFIIMLKEDIFIYSLDKIEFNKSFEKSIKAPTKGKKVSLKQYDSIYKVFRKRKEDLERERYKN